MSRMTGDTLSRPHLSFQRMVDLPLSVYHSLPLSLYRSLVDLPLSAYHSAYHSLAQVELSNGTKRLVVASALGGVSLLLLARHFQRRRRGRKKTQTPQWEKESALLLLSPQQPEKDNGGHQYLTLSSKNIYSSGLLPIGRGPNSKLSHSLQSLTSVRSGTSSSGCTCANVSSCWERTTGEDTCNVVNIPVTTPQNLYLMGMELFEEALRRWEQALMFRGKQEEEEEEEEARCSSIRLAAGDTIAEEMEELISPEFVHKLESLLQRAYSLQEDMEGALGMTEPSTHTHSHHGNHSDLGREELDDACSMSIASTDSFVSAAELSEQREQRSALSTGGSVGTGGVGHSPFYLEALQMAEDCKISCRVIRTELLECLGDTDFLAKLHCVRQAWQLILSERETRTFLADTGKKILSSIIAKAYKSPKRFEEVFEEMISFLENPGHWENTTLELAARGVKHLNFYDVVLDFILMDSFEDLESPPISIQNLVNNRWLNSSFKETAVASSCWSVLKQKRQQMKVPDGFIAHFYAVCEQVSPVLAWGFLGPNNSLHHFCCFFKDQVLFFLRDIFDHEKVGYNSLETLGEDLLDLLRRRCHLLVGYLDQETTPPSLAPPPSPLTPPENGYRKVIPVEN